MSLIDGVRQSAQGAMQAAMRRAVIWAPDAWVSAGRSDPALDQTQLIGAPAPRVDGELKVRGAARFAAEVRLDGMLYAALLYSTIPKGHLVSLDTSAAETAPGVTLVKTYRTMPRLRPLPSLANSMRGAASETRSSSRRVIDSTQRERPRRFNRWITAVSVRSIPKRLLTSLAISAAERRPSKPSTNSSSGSVHRRHRAQRPHVPQRGALGIYGVGAVDRVSC
jgi:hypothetical protein